MHCLHTPTQLLINGDVLSSRGDVFFFFLSFFYLFIVIIITIVILFIVFYHLNLQQSSHCRKRIIYLEFYLKKKRVYSIFNQKSFKGICCFFRTTVTSLSRSGALVPNQKPRTDSSGAFRTQRNLPGCCWSDFRGAHSLFAGCCSFGSGGNVEASSVSSFVFAELQNGCWKVGGGGGGGGWG